MGGLLEDMMILRFVFIIMTLLLTASCATSKEEVAAVVLLPPEASLNSVLNTSVYGSNVYIGIIGRMTFRGKEAEYAKLHIAHQIAMNRKCTIDYGYVYIEGTLRDNHTFQDSNIEYDDTTIDGILENITVLEEYRLKNFTVIVAEDTSAVGSANYNIERVEDERPDWVRKTPDIEGFYVGIGVNDRYSETYKGIWVADVLAAQTIAKENNLYVQSFTHDIVEGGAKNYTSTVTGDITLSHADLYGFYVLDRWVEKDGTCYSLAIARKN